ncbi:hypothetical protein ACFOW9_14310 [Arthrobacter cryoconiti]|uniref:Uncharacterized protein n=2 Tax=Arthrobacter cryoconiti TaxID=748907 RepID=A0ABV8R6G2_9MICC|nr:hypothetical protein [Arthrobacter cryoconiti]
MEQPHATLSAAEAQELLAKAQGIASTATKAAAWPAAMVFTSLAILGSLLMIGLEIVAHTGYGAPLLASSVGLWAVISSFTWPLMQRTTKAGFSKRFLTSLAAYMVLYVVALLVAFIAFPHGNPVYYVSAAIVLAGVGLAAAFRELRA